MFCDDEVSCLPPAEIPARDDEVRRAFVLFWRLKLKIYSTGVVFCGPERVSLET